ncbi:unnamed protein product [Phytophthora fragariaefolia]|uniref:Unnamed protein product n=1 Tax=Phytophthora fragariaefolia TaxID=1490495 RepID=A0A9W6TPG2_9STRA|nr:unnamed protein product [Phytophthora fragariaefolia]
MASVTTKWSASLIAQKSSSAAGRRSAQLGAVGDHSSRSSFTPFGSFGCGGFRTPSPFPERPASGRSATPTCRGSEEILSNKYGNDPDLGPDPTTNNSLDDPASCPLCASQWGWRRRKDAAVLARQTSLIVWRLLNASRRLVLQR